MRCSRAISPRRKASLPRPQAIARIKAAKPGIPVLVDPVLGDAGRLYVAPGDGRGDPRRAAAARHHRHAQPVRARLADRHATADDSAGGGAGSAAPGPADGRGHLGVGDRRPGSPRCWSAPSRRIERETPKRAGIPNGAGDLFAGLFLGHPAQRPRRRGGARCQPRRPRPRAGSQRRPRRAAARCAGRGHRRAIDETASVRAASRGIIRPGYRSHECRQSNWR